MAKIQCGEGPGEHRGETMSVRQRPEEVREEATYSPDAAPASASTLRQDCVQHVGIPCGWSRVSKGEWEEVRAECTGSCGPRTLALALSCA